VGARLDADGGLLDRHRMQPPPPDPTATGNFSTVDADGRLTVLDRDKLVTVRGGANVCPAEVERILAEHHALSAAAGCRVPDARLGARVAEVVTGHNWDLDVPSLVERCRAPSRRASPSAMPARSSTVNGRRSSTSTPSCLHCCYEALTPPPAAVMNDRGWTAGSAPSRSR
jgi:long-chain acyl-CoA synthetase